MENQRPPDAPQSFDGLLASQGDSLSGVQDPSALERPINTVQSTPEYIVVSQKRSLGMRLRYLAFGIAAILVLGGGIFAFISRSSRASEVQAGNFGTIHIPLSKVSTTNSLSDSAQTLKVNGQLEVTNSIILSPTLTPTAPKTGQLYYDKTANQLAYYNGQQFIGLGGSTTNISNINNVSGGSSTNVAGVQLQSESPGIQQTGNFNISGNGIVGSLTTNIINSNGQALYINPLESSVVSAGAGISINATLGLTTIGATSTGSSINNTIIGTKATMGDIGGTATSITVYLAGGSASKHIQVALYDDDGDVPSRPAGLLATSAVVNLVPNSFNTIPIPSIALTPNATYWMTFNTDDTTVARPFNGANKASCFYGIAFGFMPDPFGSGPCFFTNELYTIYVNYKGTSGGAGSFSKALFSLSPTGQATFQNSQDSTTAFQVQNASGATTVFNVDTINGRIAIGKATAAYKLDIAAGDINLSNGRSVRFNGSQALTVNASGSATSISNFSPGGSVVAQADSFVVQDANAFHQNLVIDNGGASTFSNRVNSTTAFQIQTATGTPLLRADTSNLQVYVGNPAGDATPVLLFLANKNTVGDPVGAAGAMYYNSTLASFRCFYSGFWHNCGDIEPQHSFSLYDEFIGGQTSLTGQIGSLGWNALAIGANGSLSINPSTPAPSADRPGVLKVTTPASANQGTTLSLGDTSGGSMIIAKDNDMKVAVAVGAATGQVLRVGLDNETTGTGQPTSGVWWEANPGTSANWRYCYGDGATATCADSGVAIAANSWVTLEIRITASGNGTSGASFVINNAALTVSAVTIDTTGRVSPALSCYGISGVAQNCYWDYFQLTGTTAASR